MKNYLILLSILLLSSFQCGKDKDVSFYVQNNSLQKIYLYATDSTIKDSVFLGERKMIIWDMYVASARFDNGYANVGIIKVTNGSSVCKKDITAEANWDFKDIGEERYEYVFTVEERDF